MTVTLGQFGAGLDLRGSLVGLAALPWLALAGVPQGARQAGEPGGIGPWGRGALALGMAAPGLALGAGLTLIGGAASGQAAGGAAAVESLVLEVTAVLLMIGLLAVAARRTRPAYALTWFAILLCLPLLAATLAWDGAAGGGVRWLSSLARISPLRWGFERAGATSAASLTELWPPLATTLVLWGLSCRGTRS